MDELEKRRNKIACPSEDIESFNQEYFETISNKEITQIKSSYQFEKALEDALNISVPENLADKILLNHRTSKRIQFLPYKTSFALAASITLVVFLLISPQKVHLSEIALTHVYHELDHLVENKTQINRDDILKDIKNLGFDLPSLPNNISYAGQCILGNKRGMHIVAKINNNAVTLFISHDSIKKKTEFKDNRFHGNIYPTETGTVILIGESIKDINQLYSQIRAI